MLKNQSNKKFYYNLVTENNYLTSAVIQVIFSASNIARILID